VTVNDIILRSRHFNDYALLLRSLIVLSYYALLLHLLIALTYLTTQHVLTNSSMMEVVATIGRPGLSLSTSSSTVIMDP